MKRSVLYRQISEWIMDFTACIRSGTDRSIAACVRSITACVRPGTDGSTGIIPSLYIRQRPVEHVCSMSDPADDPQHSPISCCHELADTIEMGV